MPLLTPVEDFSRRTLHDLEGALARLCYVASLKDERGHYRHWGLERTYGQRAVDELGVTVHGEALREVLRTSIPKLLRELKNWDLRQEHARALLDAMLVSERKLLSEGCTRTAALHLKLILVALRVLAGVRHLQGSTHQVA